MELKSNYQNEELNVNRLDKEELTKQLMNLYVWEGLGNKKEYQTRGFSYSFGCDKAYC